MPVPQTSGGISRRVRRQAVGLSLIHILTKTLDSYSVAVQQMIAIARAVDIQAKVLILDEPTSSLDENETQRLFDVMRDLKKQGLGIIFVSHFLDQIYEVCDRVCLLYTSRCV